MVDQNDLVSIEGQVVSVGEGSNPGRVLFWIRYVPAVIAIYHHPPNPGRFRP